MCGIAGRISFDGHLDKRKELSLISQLLGELRHRGPDDQGYHIDDKVWLASTRLSIIDLSSAGRMPIANEDGSLRLVFNGEIYNYLELRQKLIKTHRFKSQTDSEVLLHLYEDYGQDCLKYLRGMFAFGIWDGREKRLFLARDRFGKKPLKYFFNSRFFIFASELKALLDYPGVPKKIDFEAIDQFLTMDYIPSPKTGFEGILKLPPATYMTVDLNGNISSCEYWQLSYSPKINLSAEEWEERITDKLTESVKLRLRSDVPLGVHLSGGVDSSLITALASINSKKSLVTFSVGFKDDLNELRFAKMVADKYQTTHHEIFLEKSALADLGKLVFPYEEPFADPSILPTWLLMERSKREIKVALNGDGGDENFGGYRRYQMALVYQLIKDLPLKRSVGSFLKFLNKISGSRKINKALRFFEENYPSFYSNLVNSSDSKFKEELYSAQFKRRLGGSYQQNFLVEKFAQLPNKLGWLDDLLLLDVKTYLPDDLMTKVDIASMSHSLEVRSPFLDHELMELTAKMPTDLKIKMFQTKAILKKIALRFLPKECVERKKQGFAPSLENWIGPNRTYLERELLNKDFLSRGFFEKERIKDMLSSEFLSPRTNARILWRLLYFKHWLLLWF